MSVAFQLCRRPKCRPEQDESALFCVARVTLKSVLFCRLPPSLGQARCPTVKPFHTSSVALLPI